MKGIFAILLLACVALAVVSADYCGSLESCGEGQCCSGGFYHRYCRSYADEANLANNQTGLNITLLFQDARKHKTMARSTFRKFLIMQEIILCKKKMESDFMKLQTKIVWLISVLIVN
ncbi:hypothetical protein CEXT_240051 [Caerostris extrusa]|uniref:Uncharacterized protein n=1 Tax=Caerostris extrusa TaxID=172846 RepID=A0AAV4MIY4_CAEEX|nr:hypothetical protein CEXT_240051 [Caerostris extrusa]